MVQQEELKIVGTPYGPGSVPKFTGSCPVCGSAFVAYRSTRKFCSDVCRATFARQLHLKAKFNLTLAEYDAIAKSQEGRCAICHNVQPSGYLHVDHDHSTGRIRGLLCSGCNTGISGFHDDVARLRSAITYLRQRSLEPLGFPLEAPSGRA